MIDLFVPASVNMIIVSDICLDLASENLREKRDYPRWKGISHNRKITKRVDILGTEARMMLDMARMQNNLNMTNKPRKRILAGICGASFVSISLAPSLTKLAWCQGFSCA